MSQDEIEVDSEAARPSKSARKRAATALQQMGVELAGLSDEMLLTLNLPEALVAALQDLRRLKSRAAASRQRQYIGKLMRKLDATAIEDKLADLRREHDVAARRFARMRR
jgi:ribosome-associated protein